jgi:hypothetical protein
MIPTRKYTTGLCPPPPGGEPCFASLPDWYDHPSWITGMQALEHYHHWVVAVVLPIAFQWIHEHYDEVYKLVPDRQKNEDDVGVVIAAAYQLVRQLGAYEKGRAAGEDLKDKMDKGEFDISRLNPIWAKITREVRKSTREIFDAERHYLDDTI